MMELEEQMGKFKSAIGDSIRKSSPLRQNERKLRSMYNMLLIERETAGRLHWPRMGGNESGVKTLNKNDNLSFGEIH